MKYVLLITFFGITLLVAGCTDNTSSATATPTSTLNTAEASNDPIPSETTELSIESEIPEHEVPESENPDTYFVEAGKILEDKYYSIKSNNTLVQLRLDEKSVLHTLGEPIKETTPQKLGAGADTFSEMYSKTTSYEGLSLLFLGMSEEDLWVTDIKVNGDKYQTSEGIKVGDSLKSLFNAYPNIQFMATIVIEEKPNSRVYRFWQDHLGFFAEFIVDENDIIEEIHMYYLFD